MTRLRDIKYLTKNKVRALAPIFYVQPGIRCGNIITKANYRRLEGIDLDKALEIDYFLYDDDKMFTTEKEAQELVDKFNNKRM